MKTAPPSARAMEFRTAIVDAMRANVTPEHEMDPLEMLAVMAQLVGNLIANQDGSRFSPAAIMNMVALNIEAGNREAAALIISDAGGVQ